MESASAGKKARTVDNVHDDDDDDTKSALVPLSHKLTINPELIAKLVQRGVLGFQRPFSKRNPTHRYYTINIDAFRSAISFILENYLLVKLREYGERYCETSAKEMTHLVVNACVVALYARLRSIHQSFGDYANRYASTSDFDDDFEFELPLPFADAIQNFGPFNPGGILDNFVCIPVHHPENVLQNEGPPGPSLDYEAIIPRLKKLGIPFMSVDTTTVKCGGTSSSWWCFRSKIVEGTCDLCCIYPPSNYSEHAAVLASMFIVTNGEGNATVQLVDQRTDDVEYPVRMRTIPFGFQLRAFAALCHAPSEEWRSVLLNPD